MDYKNYFKDLLQSTPDYRKIVLIIFLNQNDKNLLPEIGFNKNDISRLSLELKNILKEEHENYLDYIEDQEESNLESFLNR